MYRIGTVGYLNAKPLTKHIDRSQYDVIEGHPSHIAGMLDRKEVDVGLVPVVAVLENPSLRVDGGFCIGAKGPVTSVYLVAETPPEKWTQVLLDDVSRTSVVLSHLLLDGPLSRRVSRRLRRQSVPPMKARRRAKGTVAALVIGDGARNLPDRFTTRLDLAQLWTDWTGLPFVFAVWAGHENVDRKVLAMLRASAQIGLAERETLYEGQDAHYLTQSIRYAFDEEALVGLRRFSALAHQGGWVKSDLIQFYLPEPSQKERSVGAQDALGQIAEGHDASLEEMLELIEQVSHVELGLVAHDLRVTRCGDQDQAISAYYTLPVSLDETSTAQQITERWDAFKHFGGHNLVLWNAAAVEWSLKEWANNLTLWTAKGSRIWAHSLETLESLAGKEGVPLSDAVDVLLKAGLQGLAAGAVVSMRDGGRSGLEALERQRALGVGKSVVFEYGYGETSADRVRALFALKGVTGLDWIRMIPVTPGQEGAVPMSATAQDHLQMTALGRIILSNVSDHWAVWYPGARVIAQQALLAGCNGLGAVLFPEGGALEDWEKTQIEIKLDVRDAGLHVLGEKPSDGSVRSGASTRPRPPLS